jgi:hypothetical protein
MTIQFEGMTGERRKVLVNAISEATGEQIAYKGAPGFQYQVGPYSVLKDGSVETDDFADHKEIGALLVALRARGFLQQGDAWAEPEEPPTEKELAACMSIPSADSIVLIFPKDDMDGTAVANLKRLIEGKGWLIRKALEVSELSIEETEDALRFPWLPGTAPSELINACALLIAALIKMAKQQKRVVLTERETDNPKYAFRCFLLRLGFIGDEYKDARKLLMRGIPGNGSNRYIAEEPVSPEK